MSDQSSNRSAARLVVLVLLLVLMRLLLVPPCYLRRTANSALVAVRCQGAFDSVWLSELVAVEVMSTGFVLSRLQENVRFMTSGLSYGVDKVLLVVAVEVEVVW